MTSLTPKEKDFLQFVETFYEDRGYSPSFIEIQEHFQYASINSVQKYIKQLQKKGYLYSPGQNKKRALKVLRSHNFKPSKNEAFSANVIAFLGKVAAGRPLERVHSGEFIEVSDHLTQNHKDIFALEVEGQSMIDEGILEGDVLLIRKKIHYDNGSLVVASVEEGATVKKMYKHKDCIELRPSCEGMESLYYSYDQVRIEGFVVSLMRRF